MGPILRWKIAEALGKGRLVARRHVMDGAVFVRPGQDTLGQFNLPSPQMRHLASDPDQCKRVLQLMCCLLQVVNIRQGV